MKPPETNPLDDRTVVLVSVAKRQWERTFDAISEPLMIVDEDFVIRRANLALAEDLGMAVQRLVGQTCHDLRAESERPFERTPGQPCAQCPVREARQRNEPRDAELPSSGGRVYRLRAYPLSDDGEALTVCRYRDVTEEKALARKLSHAEKLAAIGRLAGGVAHEINNPLGGILAFTQILLRNQVSAEEREEYLREIEKSALRCKAIVESLLRFARQNPMSARKPLSLNDVVNESLRFVHYKFPAADVDVNTRLQPDLPAIEGNASQMEQVMVNLLTNAFDAVTPTPMQRRGWIEVRTRALGDQVLLEVADNGTGFSAEDVQKLFDPFFTTKEEGKGTGLGLAVTYAIVQEHGGTIAASNSEGGGAVFTVALPAVRG